MEKEWIDAYSFVRIHFSGENYTRIINMSMFGERKKLVFVFCCHNSLWLSFVTIFIQRWYECFHIVSQKMSFVFWLNSLVCFAEFPRAKQITAYIFTFTLFLSHAKPLVSQYFILFYSIVLTLKMKTNISFYGMKIDINMETSQ